MTHECCCLAYCEPNLLQNVRRYHAGNLVEETKLSRASGRRKRQLNSLPYLTRHETRRLAGALSIALAADELLDAAVGFVVGHLHGRMLGKEGGGGMEDAADAAVERELA